MKNYLALLISGIVLVIAIKASATEMKAPVILEGRVIQKSVPMAKQLRVIAYSRPKTYATRVVINKKNIMSFPSFVGKAHAVSLKK